MAFKSASAAQIDRVVGQGGPQFDLFVMPAAAVQLREQLSTFRYSTPHDANVFTSCSSCPCEAMQPPHVVGPTHVYLRTMMGTMWSCWYDDKGPRLGAE